jgi:hypothetical protein
VLFYDKVGIDEHLGAGVGFGVSFLCVRHFCFISHIVHAEAFNGYQPNQSRRKWFTKEGYLRRPLERSLSGVAGSTALDSNPRLKWEPHSTVEAERIAGERHGGVGKTAR